MVFFYFAESFSRNSKGPEVRFFGKLLIVLVFCPNLKQTYCFLLGGVPPSNVMCPAFLFLTSEVC